MSPPPDCGDSGCRGRKRGGGGAGLVWIRLKSSRISLAVLVVINGSCQMLPHFTTPVKTKKHLDYFGINMCSQSIWRCYLGFKLLFEFIDGWQCVCSLSDRKNLRQMRPPHYWCGQPKIELLQYERSIPNVWTIKTSWKAAATAITTHHQLDRSAKTYQWTPERPKAEGSFFHYNFELLVSQWLCLAPVGQWLVRIAHGWTFGLTLRRV